MFNMIKSHLDNLKVTPFKKINSLSKKKKIAYTGFRTSRNNFFFFKRIKLIYNISLSRKMYILYLYTLQDALDLLCISMGGIYYRIIWLHYKAISEKHFVLQETIHRWDPITWLFCRQFQTLLLTAAKLCHVFIKM